MNLRVPHALCTDVPRYALRLRMVVLNICRRSSNKHFVQGCFLVFFFCDSGNKKYETTENRTYASVVFMTKVALGTSL
jgi:hypothetical protein